MNLLFKQRLFSWLDSYDVFTIDGEKVFEVKGQLSIAIPNPDNALMALMAVLAIDAAKCSQNS